VSGPPALRASDAEREQVVRTLREHCVAGRLTLEEFAGRTESALAARTSAELEPLTRDLPAREQAVPSGGRRSLLVNVIGGVSRKGRWRAPERITVVNILGGVDLDLRGAQLDGSEIVITQFAFMGGLSVTVPEGIEVDVGGFALIGGVDHEGSGKPPLPGAPRVRVRGFTLIGGTSVVTA
jgi:hypothetical protein